MRRPDYIFVLLLGAYALFGLMMLTSATGPVAFQKFGDAYWYLKHQVVYGLLPGLFVFVAAWRLDYRLWRRFAGPAFAVALILLTLVFIPALQSDWGTSRSWISIGGRSLQPVEIVKLLLTIFLAERFSRAASEDSAGVGASLWPFLAALGAVALLLMLQPDLGGLAVIAVMAGVMYFAAGAPGKHLIGLLAAGAVGSFLLIRSAPYRAARLMTFLHPENDPQGIGYHINQAYLAIGTGGWFGLGLGHSRQKYLYLPEVPGDSIFAVVVEELGFVLAVAVLVLIGAIVWRGLRIASEAPDGFGRLLTTGIVAWFAAQALFNIGSMTGIFPITGLALPLVSYGGTAYFALLAAFGVVLSVSAAAGPVSPAAARR